VTEDILPSVDLPITAHIPNEYIPGEAERIYFYKRMSAVRKVEDIENLQAELEDRFGDPPRPVWDALAVLRLRLRCKEIGIASVKGERIDVTFKFAPSVRLTPDSLKLLAHAFKGHRFTADGVIVPLTSAKVMTQVEEIVAVLEQALAHGRDKNGKAKNGNGKNGSGIGGNGNSVKPSTVAETASSGAPRSPQPVR